MGRGARRPAAEERRGVLFCKGGEAGCKVGREARFRYLGEKVECRGEVFCYLS